MRMKVMNRLEKILAGLVTSASIWVGINSCRYESGGFSRNQKQSQMIEAQMIESKKESKIREKAERKTVKIDFKKDYSTKDFSSDSDTVLLARMLFGEARNCSRKEKIAVAYTAINRVKRQSWYGKNLREVLLKPYQYTCFNKNDPNLDKLKNPLKSNARAFNECLEIARLVLSGQADDPTSNATHYFTGKKPGWADKMTRIGRIKNSRHEFYRE